MICQECGVRFSDTKIDRFEYEDETFCSENCSSEAGWHGTDDTSRRTAALFAELVHAVKDTPPTRVFTRRERQSLNDTLAILNFESGAARKAGPPATLPLILARVKKLQRTDDWCFGFCTLAQLEETIAMLGDDGCTSPQ